MCFYEQGNGGLKYGATITQEFPLVLPSALRVLLACARTGDMESTRSHQCVTSMEKSPDGSALEQGRCFLRWVHLIPVQPAPNRCATC